MDVKIFVCIASVMCFLLGVMWSKDTWHDFSIKAFLYAMFVYGLLIMLFQRGLIFA